MKRVAHRWLGGEAITGVDMIELDVLPVDARDRSSRLVVTHDYGTDVHAAVALPEALERAAATGLELNVDLKLAGYEARVVDELRSLGLLERTLVSTMERSSLARLRAAEPSLRLGLSVPRVRRDWNASPLTRYPAAAVVFAARRSLPGRVERRLRAGAFEALMAYHHLVTPALVDAVRRGGGELYAWTVNDAASIRRLIGMGVGAIITDDPALLASGMDAG